MAKEFTFIKNVVKHSIRLCKELIMLLNSGVPRGSGGGESSWAAVPKGQHFQGGGKNACKIGGNRCKNENLKVND